jgi:hypothetical protein
LNKIKGWSRNAIIATIPLIMLSALIYSYAQTNQIFAIIMLGGGGVLAAIVLKAKGFF